MENLEDKMLPFGYSHFSYLDHLSILNWINYMAHKCNVGKKVKNLDERAYVVLPSGKKVVITIEIEEFKEIDQNKLNHLAMSG